MNEELQRELAAWLASMRDSAGQAANFALEQAPLLVREMVTYGRVTATLFAVLVLILFLLSIVALYKAVTDNSAEEKWDNAGIAGVFAGGACIIAGIGGTPHFVKVWFAPRLYIMEWLASLVK